MQQLDVSADHLADRNSIALVQIFPQPEIGIQGVTILLFSQFSHESSQIIRNESVIVGEMFRPEFRDFPTGVVAMDTVAESRVRSHFWRDRVEQARRFQQDIDRLVDIADKDHRCRSRFFFLAPGKGSRCHIVFHDLDTILVLEFDAGYFIKGHTVPQADQSNLMAGHVVKEVGYRRLAARNEDTVR